MENKNKTSRKKTGSKKVVKPIPRVSSRVLNSVKTEMFNMKIGAIKDYPSAKSRTIQNYRTYLNAENYQQGYFWEAQILKEEGVIRVKRIS